MSLRVLVILEDFRKDQYMVEPLLAKMLASIGASRAKIEVCRDPQIRGVNQAISWAKLQEVFSLHAMVDLFILAVDRDAEAGRVQQLTALESQSEKIGKKLIAEHAWQEIEVWVLAGMPDFRETWAEVRASRDPKEQYYDPYAKRRGVFENVAEGRKVLGLEAASNYQRVRSKCSEDVQNLENRLKEYKSSLKTFA